jgi:hypothetical protein
LEPVTPGHGALGQKAVACTAGAALQGPRDDGDRRNFEGGENGLAGQLPNPATTRTYEPLPASLATRSNDPGALRVTLRELEVQNELEVTKVLLAGRTVEVKEKDLALSETEATFHNTRDELHVTREELRSVGITLHDTEDLLSAAKTKSTTWYSLLRLERRKVVRLRGHQPRLRDAVAAAYNLDTTSRDQRCRRKSCRHCPVFWLGR